MRAHERDHIQYNIQYDKMSFDPKEMIDMTVFFLLFIVIIEQNSLEDNVLVCVMLLFYKTTIQLINRRSITILMGCFASYLPTVEQFRVSCMIYSYENGFESFMMNESSNL